MASKLEIAISENITKGGEGPHWDADTQSLYFVDIFGHYIHKYVPSTKKHTRAFTGKTASFIIPVKGKSDQFVISMGPELVLIIWDGESDSVSVVKKLYEIDQTVDNVIFNDGKCDPSGRLWAGSMGVPENGVFKDEKGSLYSFQNNKITTHVTKVGISNGLAFNKDLKKFYYVDSFKGSVDQYDFDITKGTISNGTPVYTLREKRGLEDGLDGMTIDTNGNLWVAVFNRSKVIQINPRKPQTVLQTIQIPTKKVTSVTFGGPNLDELYVTTFGTDGSTAPEDGAVYKVTGLNAKGFPGERIIL